MSELDMPPAHDGINISRGKDGSWFLSVSISAETFKRLHGTKPFNDFVLNFVALFQNTAGKGN